MNRSPGYTVLVSIDTPDTANGRLAEPLVAIAISSEVHSGSAMTERLARLDHIIERVDHAVDGLPLLMALAGDHQDIAVA